MKGFVLFGIKNFNLWHQLLFIALIECLIAAMLFLFQIHDERAYAYMFTGLLIYVIMNPFFMYKQQYSKPVYIVFSVVIFILIILAIISVGNLLTGNKITHFQEIMIMLYSVSFFYFSIYMVSFVFMFIVNMLENLDQK
ncbi:MAG: hypothetical protein H6553_08590 [Chitinophagales bacterium]|nr:hypothetical protein [Chitinophagales bacterium]